MVKNGSIVLSFEWEDFNEQHSIKMMAQIMSNADLRPGRIRFPIVRTPGGRCRQLPALLTLGHPRAPALALCFFLVAHADRARVPPHCGARQRSILCAVFVGGQCACTRRGAIEPTRGTMVTEFWIGHSLVLMFPVSFSCQGLQSIPAERRTRRFAICAEVSPG